MLERCGEGVYKNGKPPPVRVGRLLNWFSKPVGFFRLHNTQPMEESSTHTFRVGFVVLKVDVEDASSGKGICNATIRASSLFSCINKFVCNRQIMRRGDPHATLTVETLASVFIGDQCSKHVSFPVFQPLVRRNAATAAQANPASLVTDIPLFTTMSYTAGTTAWVTSWFAISVPMFIGVAFVRAPL